MINAIFLVVLLFILGCSSSQEQVSAETQLPLTEEDKAVDSKLSLLATFINLGTPMDMENGVYIVKVKAMPGRVFDYIIRLEDFDNSVGNVDSLKTELLPNFKKAIDDHPKISTLKADSVIFISHYYDKNNHYIGDAKLTPDLYEP